MAKLVTTDLSNLTNETSAVSTINNNNTAIETAVENTLSRDGTSPNEMGANLDMNGYRILNIAAPTEPTDVVRLEDVQEGIMGTVEVGTVTTLSPGASATVTNVGDEHNAILDFGIPQGATGAAGTIGGSTGATDNRVLRSDGTGGATLQNSAVTIDDSGNVSGVAVLTTTGNIELGHASDTTISRTGAGAIAVEGVGVALNSTSLAHTASTLELGHASDTTLSRASAGVVAVEGVNLTPHIPVSSKSAAYTTVLGDQNTIIYHPSSDNNPRTFTIDSNANVAYQVGTTLTFVNDINTVTIAITSDTMVFAGPNSTGSRTLAAGGMATAVKVASTKWYISGAGLS